VVLNWALVSLAVMLVVFLSGCLGFCVVLGCSYV